MPPLTHALYDFDRRLACTILCLLSLSSLVKCIPIHAAHATVVSNQGDVLDEYDYIVVGAGTAGLTVGDRLSENGECKSRLQLDL